MTDAEIVAELFEAPCNYSPIDEYMSEDDYCEHNCGDDLQTFAKCWQRYFDLRRKEKEK